MNPSKEIWPCKPRSYWDYFMERSKVHGGRAICGCNAWWSRLCAFGVFSLAETVKKFRDFVTKQKMARKSLNYIYLCCHETHIYFRDKFVTS